MSISWGWLEESRKLKSKAVEEISCTLATHPEKKGVDQKHRSRICYKSHREVNERAVGWGCNSVSHIGML